jgi:hypothetical protein
MAHGHFYLGRPESFWGNTNGRIPGASPAGLWDVPASFVPKQDLQTLSAAHWKMAPDRSSFKVARESSVDSAKTLVADPPNPTPSFSIPPIKYLLAELGLLDEDSMSHLRGPGLAEHDGLESGQNHWDSPAPAWPVTETGSRQSSPGTLDSDVTPLSREGTGQTTDRIQQPTSPPKTRPRRRRPAGSGTSSNFSRRSRSFSCDACDATFFSKQHLSRHRHIHDVEKPHPCPGCERRFARSDNMKIHCQRAHGI